MDTKQRGKDESSNKGPIEKELKPVAQLPPCRPWSADVGWENRHCMQAWLVPHVPHKLPEVWHAIKAKGGSDWGNKWA